MTLMTRYGGHPPAGPAIAWVLSMVLIGLGILSIREVIRDFQNANLGFYDWLCRRGAGLIGRILVVFGAAGILVLVSLSGK